ncbi:MAG: hypothetical protein LBN08_06365 [Lactobacillales bacterium]|jgi:cell division protein FtsL|nr:hypothetical protein [Lactobacillales bacterium]
MNAAQKLTTIRPYEVEQPKIAPNAYTTELQKSFAQARSKEIQKLRVAHVKFIKVAIVAGLTVAGLLATVMITTTSIATLEAQISHSKAIVQANSDEIAQKVDAKKDLIKKDRLTDIAKNQGLVPMATNAPRLK